MAPMMNGGHMNQPIKATETGADTINKCTCGCCPQSRIARGLKCFAQLESKNDGYFTKRRNGYSFATGVSYGRGRDVMVKR